MSPDLKKRITFKTHTIISNLVSGLSDPYKFIASLYDILGNGTEMAGRSVGQEYLSSSSMRHLISSWFMKDISMSTWKINGRQVKKFVTLINDILKKQKTETNKKNRNLRS